MSGFIYFIFMIGIALITVSSSKKKKDTESNKKPNPRSFLPEKPKMSCPENPLTEAWKNVILDEKRLKEPFNGTTQIKKMKVTNKPPMKENKTFPDIKEEEKHTLSSFVPNQNNKEEDYTFQDIDDIRKAIVWFEILKRKY